MNLLHIINLNPSEVSYVEALAARASSFSHLQTLLNASESLKISAWADHLSQNGVLSTAVAKNVPAMLSLLASDHNITLRGDCTHTLPQLVSHLAPDVILINEPYDFSPESLQQMKGSCRVLAAWQETYLNPTSSIAPIDLLLSPSAAAREAARRWGAKDALEFYQGALITTGLNTELATSTSCDIIFCGDWDTLNEQGRRCLLEVSKGALGWHGGYSMRFYMPRHTGLDTMPIGTAMQVEYRPTSPIHSALPAAKMALCLDSESSPLDPPDAFMFEAAASGMLLLTNSSTRAARFFEVSREIQAFHAPDQVAQTVRWLLDHDAERRSIALAGQQRCLRDHHISARMALLARELRARL